MQCLVLGHQGEKDRPRCHPHGASAPAHSGLLTCGGLTAKLAPFPWEGHLQRDSVTSEQDCLRKKSPENKRFLILNRHLAGGENDEIFNDKKCWHVSRHFNGSSPAEKQSSARWVPAHGGFPLCSSESLGLSVQQRESLVCL